MKDDVCVSGVRVDGYRNGGELGRLVKVVTNR